MKSKTTEEERQPIAIDRQDVSVSISTDTILPAVEKETEIETGPTPTADDLILAANGHKPELRRQFNWLSALGLGFSITNSWVGYLSNFGQNMAYSGPRLVIVGLVLAFLAQSVITIGLAEIGSAFPSSGGQYHFCYLLAPKKSRRFAAYIVGWMSVIAWWVTTSSGISLCATTLAGIIHSFDPSFTATQWQIYLFFAATAVITIIPIFVASQKISMICQAALLLTVVGMALTLFVPVGTHTLVQPASFLASTQAGETGWRSGVAWMLGVCNGMYAFGGTDAALHISEEMANPGRRVPQIIMATLLMGLLTTLPLFIALLLFARDTNAIVEAPLPSFELIYQATGSRALSLFLITWILLIYISCIPSQWVTCGRMAWAFARDNGVPFPTYFSHISQRFHFPVRTTTAAFLFVLAYGLLYLASTTAFNSIITSAVLFLNITYTVPQGILLVNRLSAMYKTRTQDRNPNPTSTAHRILPCRYLNLGPLGVLCNIFSVTWIIVLGVFVSFPPKLPVSVGNANYTPPVVVGIFGVIVLFWGISGRRTFTGPVGVDWTIPTPVLTLGSALIRALAAPVLSYHRSIYSGTRPNPIPTPLTTGFSFIGRIAATGADATVLKPERLVYADSVVRARDDPDVSFLSGVFEEFSPPSKKLMRDVWNGGGRSFAGAREGAVGELFCA
ncbi:amino acid permease-domain-containing protein [Aspergillus undulatus]|uniref:amino acid permease-domain-containing protein n=1 Tax=Aspergillus undulatus TaxID=1810928 RepID=UPI003CCD8BB8